MHILAIGVIGCLLVACGPMRAPTPGVRLVEPLVDGEGTYPVRYNPPPCLADQPELHAEVRTPAGWERVALETGPDDTDLVAALMTRFDADRAAVIPVRGNLTNRTRPWAGQHASRIFSVQEIDPPAPAGADAD